MLEYEFETVSCDHDTGYSLFGGAGLETGGHQKAICRRAADGWRLGFIETLDLIFEREAPDK